MERELVLRTALTIQPLAPVLGQHQAAHLSGPVWSFVAVGIGAPRQARNRKRVMLARQGDALGAVMHGRCAFSWGGQSRPWS